MVSSGPTVGADPVAAVFGGIVLLATFAVLLVLRRDHLRRGIEIPRWAWGPIGGVGAVSLYAIGLVAIGRTGDLLWFDAWLSDVPWAVLILIPVGVLIAHGTGARAGWHWTGVGILGSLTLASTGWASYLATTRVADLWSEPTLVGAALLALLIAEFIALLLVCAVASYMLDGLVRRHWTRHVSQVRRDPTYEPHVAVHVASYDEPPELVIQTLDSLVAQEYPREKLTIILVDDTTRPDDVERLRVACAERGVVFLHRAERTGFKAGALNEALRATPTQATLIAVVDSDFVCRPDFIRANVGYFVQPDLAFIQTKLDYVNSGQSFTAKYATLMEHFFYTSMMRTRNEANAILFAGTMGLLRKRAIVEVGGWTDGHVGEDVDLSCRLLMAGWTSLYVPRVFGQGLQTPNQEAFRRQQARWAYGGARIMRDHGRAIFASRMTNGQKAHYLYGPLFWLDGALGTLFAMSMVVFTVAYVSGTVDWLPVHDLVFVGLVPVLIIIEAMLRSAFTMRRLLGLELREVGGMILLGWSGKLMNARSAWAALRGVPRPFHRTPKYDGPRMKPAQAARQAVRVAPVETAMAVLQLGMAIAMMSKLASHGGGALSPVLVGGAILMTLVWFAYFAAAPVCVYLGHVRKGDRRGVLAAGARRPAKAA